MSGDTIDIPLRDRLAGSIMLPPNATPYPSTLEEIEQVFVIGAPFEARRKLIFRALTFYCELVWAQSPNARLWINGGFMTLKSWAPPEDVDVVIVIPDVDKPLLTPSGLAPLLTAEKALISGNKFEAVRPLGGLVDGYFAMESNRASMEKWNNQWSQVRQSDGTIDPALRKGFVEVASR